MGLAVMAFMASHGSLLNASWQQLLIQARNLHACHYLCGSDCLLAWLPCGLAPVPVLWRSYPGQRVYLFCLWLNTLQHYITRPSCSGCLASTDSDVSDSGHLAVKETVKSFRVEVARADTAALP